MAFTVSTSDLKDALAYVEKSVSTRSTLPILGCIRLEVKDGKINVQATNLEMFASISIPYKGDDEPFDLAVPAKALKDTIKAASETTITLAAKGDKLAINAKTLKVNLNTMPGADFPIMPQVDDGTILRLPTDSLIDLLDTVVYAASKDESRPTLTGVELTLGEGTLSGAATDGYRLALQCIDVPAITDVDIDAKTMIVPAKSIAEFIRFATKAKGEEIELIIRKERNQVCLRIERVNDYLTNAMMWSQLIDARFPDYRAIIPKTQTTRVTATTTALLKAVKTAALFAKDNAHIVRVSVEPSAIERFGTLTLSATSSEVGTVEETLDVSYEGMPVDIAFNTKYLQETLDHILAAQVVIEFTQSTRPALFRGQTSVDKNDIHVVMPMHPPR